MYINSYKFDPKCLNSNVYLQPWQTLKILDWTLYRAELDSPDTVAKFVQRRRPAHDAHHIGHNQQNTSRHTRLGW